VLHQRSPAWRYPFHDDLLHLHRLRHPCAVARGCCRCRRHRRRRRRRRSRRRLTGRRGCSCARRQRRSRQTRQRRLPLRRRLSWRRARGSAGGSGCPCGNCVSRACCGAAHDVHRKAAVPRLDVPETVAQVQGPTARRAGLRGSQTSRVKGSFLRVPKSVAVATHAAPLCRRSPLLAGRVQSARVGTQDFCHTKLM